MWRKAIKAASTQNVPDITEEKIAHTFPLLPFALILSGFLCSLVALFDLRSGLLEDFALRNDLFAASDLASDAWLNDLADEILTDEGAFLNVVSTRAKAKKFKVEKGEVVKVPFTSTRKSGQGAVLQVLDIIKGSTKRKTEARRLATSIVSEAARQGYDPLFVAAVIKSESAFNELAVSHKGAQGLMQIMPATGKYLAKSEESLPKRYRLTDPGVNLKLGIKYLRELEGMYSGNRLLTLIAYNWGPGKLDRAIKHGRGVPRECYEYALKILRDHHVWNQV